MLIILNFNSGKLITNFVFKGNNVNQAEGTENLWSKWSVTGILINIFIDYLKIVLSYETPKRILLGCVRELKWKWIYYYVNIPVI